MQCETCLENKDESSFPKKQIYKLKECIKCSSKRELDRARRREDYHRNKEKRQKKHREWLSNQENYKRSLQVAREYKKKNKNKLNILRKERRKVDMNYKISEGMRSRLRYALQESGAKKRDSTLHYVGCSLENLISHIESQFDDMMEWDNWSNDIDSGWNIDHIIPCAAFNFNLENEIEECFHYSNLRPLSRKENVSKKDKHLDCSLIFFTSTKGHHGRWDLFKYTISSLNSELDLRHFRERVAHIKTENGHEDRLKEMKEFLEMYGFKVLVSIGEWKHNDPSNSHAKEYYRDMDYVFNHQLCSKSKYFLTFEDDFVPQKLIEETWFNILMEAKNILDKDNNLICVRMNRDIENNTENSIRINELILRQNIDYTPYGPTYTFQPTFVKAGAIKPAWRLIAQNIELLNNVHCELLSGYALRNFSKSDVPFAFFDPQKVNSIHIGEVNSEEIINQMNLQIEAPIINWSLL